MFERGSQYLPTNEDEKIEDVLGSFRLTRKYLRISSPSAQKYSTLSNPQYDPSSVWGWPLHESGWTLLCGFHYPDKVGLMALNKLCRLFPFEQGGRINPGHDYGGIMWLYSDAKNLLPAESSWTAYPDQDTLDPRSSKHLSIAPALSDPGTTPLLQAALEFGEAQTSSSAASSRAGISLRSNSINPFSILPHVLVDMILRRLKSRVSCVPKKSPSATLAFEKAHIWLRCFPRQIER